MRSFTILTALLATLTAVHATFIFPRVDLPACAQQCFALNYIPTNGCGTDNSCLCKDPTFSQNSLNCITSNCKSQAEVTSAVQVATAICNAVGVTSQAAGVTTAAPGEPKTFSTIPVPTSSSTATTTVNSGAASAPIGVNQPLVLFGAAAVAFAVAL